MSETPFLTSTSDQQLVLSASDAANFLAQAGIELGENEHVVIEDSNGTITSETDASSKRVISSIQNNLVHVSTENEILSEVVDHSNSHVQQSEDVAEGVDGNLTFQNVANDQISIGELESGTVLYIDPSDPRAAELLEQAGLTLRSDGSIQQIQTTSTASNEQQVEGGAMFEKQPESILPLGPDDIDQEVFNQEQLVSKENDTVLSRQVMATSVSRPDTNLIISDLPSQSYGELTASSIVESQAAPQNSSLKDLPTIESMRPKENQQQVMYSVSDEFGNSQQYMMLCPKDMDQNTLIQTLVRQISGDRTIRGKKIIKITQQRRRVAGKSGRKTNATDLNSGNNAALMNLVDATADNGVDTTSPVFAPEEPAENEGLSQVPLYVRCNYCNAFKSRLIGDTWENVLNHILPVAKEEIQATFYGDLNRHFIRSFRLQIHGRLLMGGTNSNAVEVSLTHALVCRRTKREFLIDQPNISFVAELARHVQQSQPGDSARSNSVLCIFCNAPYTYEDYLRHIGPHQELILATLNCFSGAYCSTTYDNSLRAQVNCLLCGELEAPDLRFLPCAKYSTEYSCIKKLQFAVDCFRENFGDSGFMQINTSAIAKCCVCVNSQSVQCVVFHISTTMWNGESELQDVESELTVCVTCQKQFINVVMKEQGFEERLKVFQLQNMEQLCSCLRVILSQVNPIAHLKRSLIYSVHESTSTVNSVLHNLRLAYIVQQSPRVKLSPLPELDVAASPLKAYFSCDLCFCSIDLTCLICAPIDEQKSKMLIAIVLEHLVPHTESIMQVVASSCVNQTFDLKFDIFAKISDMGKGRKIVLVLQRKFKCHSSNLEVPIVRDEESTVSHLRSGIKNERKHMASLRITASNRYGTGLHASDTMGQQSHLIEVNRFVDKNRGKFSIFAQCGCNVSLLESYTECRLCSKYSFPDFRLVAAFASASHLPQLCENCVETVLSLCLPTEPECMTLGEECLVIGEERAIGHRLVLSNGARKWLSQDGLELIKKIIDEYDCFKNLDCTTLFQDALRMHILAMLKTCTNESDILTAASGFSITEDFINSRIRAGVDESISDNGLLSSQTDNSEKTENAPVVRVLTRRQPAVQETRPSTSRSATIIRNGGSHIRHMIKRLPRPYSSGKKYGQMNMKSLMAAANDRKSPMVRDNGFETTDKQVPTNDNTGDDTDSSLKVPSGVQILAAGKGVVKIRAISDTRSLATNLTPEVRVPVRAKPGRPSAISAAASRKALASTYTGTGVNMVSRTPSGMNNIDQEKPMAAFQNTSFRDLEDEGDDEDDDEEGDEATDAYEDGFMKAASRRRYNQDDDYVPTSVTAKKLVTPSRSAESKRMRKEKQIFDL